MGGARHLHGHVALHASSKGACAGLGLCTARPPAAAALFSCCAAGRASASLRCCSPAGSPGFALVSPSLAYLVVAVPTPTWCAGKRTRSPSRCCSYMVNRRERGQGSLMCCAVLRCAVLCSATCDLFTVITCCPPQAAFHTWSAGEDDNNTGTFPMQVSHAARLAATSSRALEREASYGNRGTPACVRSAPLCSPPCTHAPAACLAAYLALGEVVR